MTQAITTTQAEVSRIVGMVVNGLTSKHSQRAYGRELNNFMAWYQATGQRGLNKPVVNDYRAAMIVAGKPTSVVNLALSAIRKLAREAADNGLIDDQDAQAIARVEGVRHEGARMGNWLTLAQAQILVNAPDVKTLKGLRDRAVLAVLIGTGLRRTEAANLTLGHIQQREGRWVIVDLLGKRNKTRSVPMSAWVKAAIDAWTSAAQITSGRAFRAVTQRGQVAGDSMTDQAIYNIVGEYALGLGLGVAAHDLRRTYAKLARKGGSAIEQIQLTLGHESLQTTQRYLGEELDLTDAPGDRIGIKLLHRWAA